MTRKTVLLRWTFVLAVFVLGLLSCLRLTINDNALDLLPGEAVRGDIRQLQDMGLVDRLFITLTVSDRLWKDPAVGARILQESAVLLGKQLEESKQFSFVLARLPKGYEIGLFTTLLPTLPLLFDSKDLYALETKTSIEGITAGLQKSFALLNSPAGIALKKHVQLDPLGLVPQVSEKLNYLRSEFSMTIDDGFFMSRDGRSCMIVAESIHSLTDPNSAFTVQKAVDDAYVSSLGGGIEARIIGSLPHTLANNKIIRRDLRLLLPAATILLALLLGFCLRNIRALVVLGIPFMAAPAAIGLTGFVYGDLSALALGFGIVLLGIAVDFSIHLYLTLTKENGNRRELLNLLRKPLLYATLTTSAVFMVLLFSQVVSHRQMATLALFGVLLAVLFAWLVIPTITRFRQKQSPVSALNVNIDPASLKHPQLLVGLWVLLLVAGLFTWPRLQYNGDLRVLDVPDRQVVADDKHFSDTWGQNGEQAFIVARGKSLSEVLNRNSLVYRFLKNNSISEFQSFAPILPGPDIQADNLAGWDTFWKERRPEFDTQFMVKAVELGFTEKAFEPFFAWLDDTPEQLSPEKFLADPLQPLFRSMLKIPNSAQGGTKEFLAMTTVTAGDETLPVLLQLDSETEGVSVLANKKWRSEVERLLRRDILTLSLAAGAAIVLLVGIQFRNFRAVIAVLAPVLSALSAMSVFCYVTNGELNMMHLIMGIMVIGLSVDYGIFIVCAKRSNHLTTSSMAVSICAASSLIGFGVLAFADHPALHALGITVLVGIGVAWPTALLISPVLLAYKRKG
ncbi:MAG: hypothetical protein WBB23_11140 [Desulforhopalus sp.]